MAKLFAKVYTEKSEIHKIANEQLEICVYYGSRDDSRLLLKALVCAQKDAFQIPDLFLKTNVQPKSFTIENKPQKPEPKLLDFTSEKGIDFASYAFALEEYIRSLEQTIRPEIKASQISDEHAVHTVE